MHFKGKSHYFCAILALLAPGIGLAADDRIAAPVDANRAFVLRGHVHPNAQPQFDQGPLDPATELSYVSLLLTPSTSLAAFLDSQRNPGSPDFQHWLTPEQFGDRFGLSGDDLSKIITWLQSQGLRIHDVARGRHWITFSGTAAQVGRALRTEIRRFRVNGVDHFSNSTDPSIPAALAPVVSGFAGLNDFDYQPAYRNSRLAPDYNSGSSHYLAPDDFAAIYDLTPLYAAGIDGTGQKIAIIGRTDVDLTDIRAFRKRFNLPAKDPQLVLFGTDPGTSAGDLTEADLDLEWSGAIARNATIIYVYSRGINISAQYAVDQNIAPVMSMSYGSCELANQLGLRYIAQQANAQGITWIASSGDQGAATCDLSAETPQASKGLTADFPASIPEITGVGGTRFSEGNANYWASTNSANGASALSYIPEIVWNDSVERNQLAASGGGASALFTKPVWQTGPGVPADNARDVPDVSLAASPDHDGYLFQTSGALRVVGGTSAGAPSFAGILALLNQYLVSKKILTQPGLGNVNPTLYRLAQSTSDIFHDITTGDNRVACEQDSPNCVNGLVGYAAGPGYDLATGLGSFDANRLVTEWTSGPSTTTSITAAPTSFALTDTLQLTATVTGSGKVIPTGSVTFLSNDISLGSAPLSAAGIATLSAAGSLVGGGNGTVSALYSGDTVFNASSGSVN
ncbi:MAG TPA: protease pro-enzyme activation domain-containing protein, partial [Bryobacteraceae bacterium]|nr:protease pro-enzyme activation domain-containing protein [Bryobacteraceae bacterium]